MATSTRSRVRPTRIALLLLAIGAGGAVVAVIAGSRSGPSADVAGARCATSGEEISRSGIDLVCTGTPGNLRWTARPSIDTPTTKRSSVGLTTVSSRSAAERNARALLLSPGLVTLSELGADAKQTYELIQVIDADGAATKELVSTGADAAKYQFCSGAATPPIPWLTVKRNFTIASGSDPKVFLFAKVHQYERGQATEFMALRRALAAACRPPVRLPDDRSGDSPEQVTLSVFDSEPLDDAGEEALVEHYRRDFARSTATGELRYSVVTRQVFVRVGDAVIQVETNLTDERAHPRTVEVAIAAARRLEVST
jgi:hypothetical protein